MHGDFLMLDESAIVRAAARAAFDADQAQYMKPFAGPRSMLHKNPAGGG